MVNGMFDLRPAPRDLAIERGDPQFQFGERQPVEVLADQFGERIAGAGKGLFDFHGRNR